ncbi:MAG: TolC family protein, partial [Armatimonadetes bacterium]|nr:TolC family protein [Armatimonadota bacterium]
MRRWIATLALLLAPLPVRADQPPAEAPLTLAQALARALSTSPRLEAARAGVSAARAREREARAAGQPSLEADIRGRAQGPAVSIDIPAPPGGAGPQLPGGGTLNPSRVLEAELRALYPLYTGGRVSAGKRAARRGELAARARVEAEAQLLVLDVTEAYLDALEALQQTQLAGAERELSEERLRIARVRQAAGAAIPLEVSQAEADLARAVQREIEAHARLRQAGATLNTLIRRPATAPLVLAALPEAEPRHPLLMPQT